MTNEDQVIQDLLMQIETCLRQVYTKGYLAGLDRAHEIFYPALTGEKHENQEAN